MEAVPVATASRSLAPRPSSVDTCTAPEMGGTGTMCGMAMVGTPAAVAERTPVGESSRATHAAGSAPMSRAASR